MHMKRHGVPTPHHDPHCTDGKAKAQGSEATLYPHKGKTLMPQTNTRPMYSAPSGPCVSREESGLWTLPGFWTQPPAGLLTKVEVAPLVFGLEEAPPGLSVDVGSLGYKELHVVFTAALDGDVQGSLTWGGGGEVTQGSGRASRNQIQLEGGQVHSVETGWRLQARTLAGSMQGP